jgi:hypothetical protein
VTPAPSESSITITIAGTNTTTLKSWPNAAPKRKLIIESETMAAGGQPVGVVAVKCSRNEGDNRINACSLFDRETETTPGQLGMHTQR